MNDRRGYDQRGRGEQRPPGGQGGGRAPGGPGGQPPQSGRNRGPGGPISPGGLSYPIPRAAARAWQRHAGQRPQNPGLIFDRFAPDRGPDANLKKRGLEAVCDAAKKADLTLAAAWRTRWEAGARFVGAETFTAETDWRLITGLGRKGPLEVGFTFHRYGLPYLPGSSLKGLARARGLYALAARLGTENITGLAKAVEQERPGTFEAKLREALGGSEPAPETWVLAADFREVFGTTSGAGRAVFLDAIPEGVPRLELDIMNPHVPQYYQGAAPPTDWQSPVPVYFLTVAARGAFCFAVGWRGPLDDRARRLRDLARTWLVGGLTELGAGAKTNAGYGYFQPLPAPPASEQRDPAPAAATTGSRASTASAPAPAETTPAAPLLWRTGTVRDWVSSRQRGVIVDDEPPNERYPFTLDALADRSRSPANKAKVRYALVKRDGKPAVVRVELMR